MLNIRFDFWLILAVWSWNDLNKLAFPAISWPYNFLLKANQNHSNKFLFSIHFLLKIHKKLPSLKRDGSYPRCHPSWRYIPSTLKMITVWTESIYLHVLLSILCSRMDSQVSFTDFHQPPVLYRTTILLLVPLIAL